MVLLSVVLTACGSASPSAHEGDGEGSIRSASIERELALLVHDLEGGRAAWDTRAWIAYHGIQDAIATCMARDGLSYPVAPAPLGSPDAPDAPVDWTPGLAPLGWLRGTMTKDAEFQAERSRTSGADVWPREGANPVYLRLSVADRVRYDQALTACSTEANSKATGLGELGPVGSRLRGELSDAVSSALDNDSITSLTGAYAACMTDHGVPAADAAGVLSVLSERVMREIPTPSSVLAKGARWEAARQAEEKLSDIDDLCRADLHEQSMALLAPVVTDFREEHADVIAAARAEWQALVEGNREALARERAAQG